jgi:cytochrome c oxidase subunit III
MVLAVHAAQQKRTGLLILNLLLTLVLGAAFLGVKGYEYHHKFEERLVPGHNFSFEHEHAPPQASNESPENAKGTEINTKNVQLFFSFYFAMTGLHALHMIIGIGVIFVLILAAVRGAFAGGHFTPIEMTGLYWHFVDIVWVFLFPLLYLIR